MEFKFLHLLKALGLGIAASAIRRFSSLTKRTN